LLNVEKIQPYRTQPIIVMGGNGHPFDEKKKELERAVLEAELYHKKNNNAQNACELHVVWTRQLGMVGIYSCFVGCPAKA